MKVIRAMIVAAILPVTLFAHAGGRDIKGTIVKVERDAVEVKRVDGTRESVSLTPSTIYRLGKAAGRWEDMRAGSRVVVHIGHDGKAVEVHLPAKK